MKKQLTLLLTILFLFACSTFLFAQEDEFIDEDTATEVAEQPEAGTTEVEQGPTPTEVGQELDKMEEISGFEEFATQIFGSRMVELFIQGGFVMWPMLILVIWALAIIIWKLVALSIAKTNLENFLGRVIPLVEEGNYEEARQECSHTKGPVAAVLAAGLEKVDKGVPSVEKAIEGAGVIEMAFLEKGFVALSTTINLAPMFGFFGTIVGMIKAFASIEAAGEVDPTIVAGGIKIALITTAAGLAIAIPVQFFNNMFLQQVDGLVIDMQKGSETLLQTLVEKKGE